MSPRADSPVDYPKLGRRIRREIVDIAVAAKRGHLGGAFSLVEAMAVLFETTLKLNSANPTDPLRDRLIFSKGHGCLALYPFLARHGFIAREELTTFCQPGSRLGGHPDHRKIPGVETSTGSLGHGLSVGVGMALAGRIDRLPYRVFVILGDGECNEGSIWEAALSAAKHRLENLVVLVDYNKMQSYAETREVLELEPFAEKWRSFGFATVEIDMDHPLRLEERLRKLPFEAGKPSAVILHTIKGKGVSICENNINWHHKAKMTDEELTQIRKELEEPAT